MEKIPYKLATLSSLIVSPRTSAAFYEELKDFSLQEMKDETIYLAKTRLKVIYPFYQYGEYATYAPESAEYYLPGTSVKGILRQGASILGSFMADDVPVHNDAIVLRNLYKAQYLEDEQKACFDVFFENVGVEMIKANVELTGEFYVKDRESAEALFKAANKSTRVKLNQMLGYLRKLEEREVYKIMSDFEVLTEYDSKKWLQQKGLPVIEARRANSAAEAITCAQTIGFPVVLKVDSSFIAHKSDAGGIKLNLQTSEEVKEAFLKITAAVKHIDPAAGVTVQSMAFPSAEMIVGMHNDPHFGPVLAFGLGGIYVEILKDVSWRLIPVNKRDISQMIQEVKGISLICGYRGKSKGDVEALKALLLLVSNLVQENKDIFSLDLNPVFVYGEGQGVKIGDARIVRGSFFRQLPVFRSLNKEMKKRFFDPASIAVVGASPDKQALSYNAIENLVRDSGHQAEVFPVHPTHKTILGLKVYPSLKLLPSAPDLVISAVNPRATLEVAKECKEVGAGGMISFTGGFKEMGKEGQSLQDGLRKISYDSEFPILGPNSPGFINFTSKLNLFFFPFSLQAGNISIITQSGGVGGIICRQLIEEGLGISKWIGVGNRISLGFEAILDYLADDPATEVIGVYMEGADDAREFVEKAREVAPKKPVLVYKSGVSSEASQVSMTHTGSMAGSYELYDAAFRQHGILPARDSLSFVSGCKALALAPLPRGNHMGFLTISGGGSIVSMDPLIKEGVGILAKLSPETEKKIKLLMGEKASILIRNPLDLTALGFNPKIFISIMESLLSDPGIDILLTTIAVHPNFPFPFEEIPRVVKSINKPILVSYWYIYGSYHNEHRRNIEILQKGGVPAYLNAEQAALGAGYLIQYAQIRENLKSII